MAIDDPNQDESQGHSQSLPPVIGSLNPISPIDPKSGPSFSDGGGTAEVTGHAPQVSNPREVREIPKRFEDGSGRSGHSAVNPSIEDVTGSVHAHGPDVHGNAIIIDEEDADLAITPAALSVHQNERTSEVDERRPGLSVPQSDNSTDNGDDIEEEMLQAAIEASRREVDGGYPDQQFGIPYVCDNGNQHLDFVLFWTVFACVFVDPFYSSFRTLLVPGLCKDHLIQMILSLHVQFQCP